MEFPDLGKHCHASFCKRLDFLPVKCQYCQQSFCDEHFQPFVHDCKCVTNSSERPVSSQELQEKLRCNLDDCISPQLALVLCSKCGKQFCVNHRHPPDHQCPSLIPNDTLSVAELASRRLLDIAESLPSQPRRKGGRKDPKMAAKVQLLKLKMAAVVCGNPLPEERVYFLVYLPVSVACPRSQPVCVSSSWTVGKTIDAVANLLKMSNHNNETNTAQVLQLFSHYDGKLLIASKTIGELIEEGILRDGCSLILEVTSRGQDKLMDLTLYT